MNVRTGVVDGRCIAIVAMLVLLCRTTSCTRSNPSDAQDSLSSDAQTTTSDRPAGATQQLDEKQIEALIEKLAISQEPAEFRPVYTPSKDTPRSDPRVIAFDAAERLKECGKAAFPGLLAHLDDDRQSVAFLRMLPASVGLACFAIIEDMVYPLPDDYGRSFYRLGADTQLHERALFLKPAMFDSKSAAAWLAARQDKPLTEIQVEALGWLIEQEKQIGFPTEEDRGLFLYPLERQRDRLLAQLRDAKPE